uniref:Dirigent protein n=1 Tax=Solanum lycopersicum TaxID=4081 RepID=A0A3Q7IHL3_SOLLC
MAMPMAQGVELGSKAVEKWFKKLPHAKQKLGSNSTIVDRAQGIYGSADQDSGALLMTLNFCYNGSTLSIIGRNAFQNYREMPIVGVFQLAQGITNGKTYWFNRTSGMLLLSIMLWFYTTHINLII